MSDEYIGPAIIILALALLASAIAWPIAWYNYNAHKVAIEHGLQEVPYGQSSTMWAKP